LLRALASDPLLNSYDVVIVDEVRLHVQVAFVEHCFGRHQAIRFDWDPVGAIVTLMAATWMPQCSCLRAR
jgi:hypothetical protein